MQIKSRMSKITQRNWWIDAVLFGSALTAALSGLYYLYFPSGGYQGGRNPYYNMQVLFSRHTWNDLHTWGGLDESSKYAFPKPISTMWQGLKY